MEFYTGRRFGTADPFVVSIPNGMEFYSFEYSCLHAA